MFETLRALAVFEITNLRNQVQRQGRLRNMGRGGHFLDRFDQSRAMGFNLDPHKGFTTFNRFNLSNLLAYGPITRLHPNLWAGLLLDPGLLNTSR